MKETSSGMSFKIDKKMLPMKIHYFLLNAGTAPLVNFGPVIAKQMGISAVSLGVLYTVLPVIGLAVRVLLSGFADKFKKRRFVLLCSLSFGIFAVFFMNFMQISSPGRNVTFMCSMETFFSSCNNHSPAPDPSKMWKDIQSVINCEVSCEADSNLIAEINSTWKKEPLTKNETISFTATIRRERVFPIAHCLYGRIHSVKLKHSDESLVPFCLRNVRASCNIKCDDYELMTALRKEKESPLKHDLKQPRFWMLLIIYILNTAGMMLSSSMSDTVCFDLLGDRPDKYGTQRMFGALSFGITTLFSGWMVDWFSQDAFFKNYKPVFYLSMILLLSDFILVSRMQVEQKVKSTSMMKDLWILFYNMRVWIFAFWCFLSGLFAGVTWQFLYWHLEDISNAEELHWSKALQGTSNVFNTVFGELPCFFISGWIIRNFGHIHTMSLILFLVALRFFLYSILIHPWWILPIEVISGFGLSMTYVVIASFSSVLALPGTESTVQATFSAIFDGLGVSLAGIFGGIIYYQHNGFVLFSLMSYCSLIALILHVLVQCKLKSDTIHKGRRGDDSSVMYRTRNDALNFLERE